MSPLLFGPSPSHHMNRYKECLVSSADEAGKLSFTQDDENPTTATPARVDAVPPTNDSLPRD